MHEKSYLPWTKRMLIRHQNIFEILQLKYEKIETRIIREE